MATKRNLHKNNRAETTRKFLLSFFSDESKYSEMEVNGYFLIKQFSNFMWSVAIYSKDLFMKRQKHRENFRSVFHNKTRGNSVSEYK